MTTKKASKGQGPGKKPYHKPAIENEDTYERHATASCSGKDGGCGPFLTS